MYLIDILPVYYSDPWASTFEERLKTLVKGQQRVAYYYEKPDNSTFRYRVYNMIQALCNNRSDISATYFTLNELDNLDKVVDITDVLVICRSHYNDKLNRIITKARNKGKLVFYDIDDLIFNPIYTHLILDTLDQDLSPNAWDLWFADISQLGATLMLCDRAITTNDYLASCIQEYSNKPVSVIPNFLNQQQMELSNQIYRKKKTSGYSRDNKIHLGYFSGTPTHNKDLDIISDALVQLLEMDPLIVIRVVGFIELKGVLKNYESRFEFFPLHDFLNLQRLIGEVELNLVPLQDNEFTNCKSELKYFEASIVGTVTIASPTFTYSKAIIDHTNGFLANSYDWYDKIETLLRNIEYMPVISEKAYIDCEQKYAWYNQTDLIERTLFLE